MTDLEGDRLCSIQVKTRRPLGSDRGRHFKAKHEKVLGDRHFYCLVDLVETLSAAPTGYVIPNGIVAGVLYASHQKWLSNPGKGGQPHKDGPMRRLRPTIRMYSDK